MTNKSRNKKSNETTVHIKVTSDTKNMFDYLAHEEQLTQKDLFAKMVDQYMAIKKERYQLPDITIQRLNKLITAVSVNNDQMKLLRQAIVNGFSTILRLDEKDEEE